MSTILVVDDDRALLKTLTSSLRAQGFETLSAYTGELGLYSATHEFPDLVIVDLGLPRTDGFEVIKKVRAFSSMPIVVLSARDAESEKVRALNAGADDYVTKPFGMDELVARINAALRRGVRADGKTVIETATLVIDLVGRRITKCGEEVHLTATEWRVLSALAGNEGKTVSHDELLALVWGAGHRAPVEYARVYVGALRKKLEVDPKNPAHIVTETSLGYRFVK